MIRARLIGASRDSIGIQPEIGERVDDMTDGTTLGVGFDTTSTSHGKAPLRVVPPLHADVAALLAERAAIIDDLRNLHDTREEMARAAWRTGGTDDGRRAEMPSEPPRHALVTVQRRIAELERRHDVLRDEANAAVR